MRIRTTLGLSAALREVAYERHRKHVQKERRKKRDTKHPECEEVGWRAWSLSDDEQVCNP